MAGNRNRRSGDASRQSFVSRPLSTVAIGKHREASGAIGNHQLLMEMLLHFHLPRLESLTEIPSRGVNLEQIAIGLIDVSVSASMATSKPSPKSTSKSTSKATTASALSWMTHQLNGSLKAQL